MRGRSSKPIVERKRAPSERAAIKVVKMRAKDDLDEVLDREFGEAALIAPAAWKAGATWERVGKLIKPDASEHFVYTIAQGVAHA